MPLNNSTLYTSNNISLGSLDGKFVFSYGTFDPYNFEKNVAVCYSLGLNR